MNRLLYIEIDCYLYFYCYIRLLFNSRLLYLILDCYITIDSVDVNYLVCVIWSYRIFYLVSVL